MSTRAGQIVALAAPLGSDERVAADDEALARVVGAFDLAQVLLVEERELQCALLDQPLHLRRLQGQWAEILGDAMVAAARLDRDAGDVDLACLRQLLLEDDLRDDDPAAVSPRPPAPACAPRQLDPRPSRLRALVRLRPRRP